MISLASSLPTADRNKAVSEAHSIDLRAARGDRHALEALLRQHTHAIFALCRVLVGAREAGDLTQESLEKIVIHIGRFDPQKGTFRAWALTVARNACRDRQRRRGLEQKTFDLEGEELTALAASETPSVERIVVSRIESARLATALEALPESMRVCLLLFHVHESSYEEIAAALGVPIGTVMTWLHRGRKRLRTILEEQEVAV